MKFAFVWFMVMVATALTAFSVEINIQDGQYGRMFFVAGVWIFGIIVISIEVFLDRWKEKNK